MSQPRQTIIFTPVPMDQEQMKRLQELFAHPGFDLLKRIIGAHASQQQVEAMNAGLYTHFSEFAKDDTRKALQRAAEYAASLEFLEDISMRQDSWFTAKLETRP